MRIRLFLGAILATFALAAPAPAFVYWGDAVSGGMGRAKLDGSDIRQHFVRSASHATGIAVDDEHVYWSEGSLGPGSVGHADLSGADEGSFYSQDGATGVAVDSGRVYFSTTNGGSTHSGYIARANIDGSDEDATLIPFTGFPGAVAVGGGDFLLARFGPGAGAGHDGPA